MDMDIRDVHTRLTGTTAQQSSHCNVVLGHHSVQHVPVHKENNKEKREMNRVSHVGLDRPSGHRYLASLWDDMQAVASELNSIK